MVTPLTNARRDLEAYRTIHAEHDPVAHMTRLITEAAIAVADQTLSSAEQLTTEMLESVAAIAAEFEDFSPPPSMFPEPGESAQEVSAFVIGGQPAPPRIGEEVEAALVHCAQLAYGRLEGRRAH